MKALVLSLLMVGFSIAAHAQAPAQAPESLAEVSKVSITVTGGGGLAAVQPYTMISVHVRSCAQRQLSAKTEKVGNVVSIRILDNNNLECFGPTVDRKYELQVSSDATGEQYVLLNPIEPMFKD